MKKSRKDKKEDSTGLYVPAGLFLGMGIGFLVNQVVGGIFLGLGLGFLGMALSRRKSKSR